MKTQHPPLRLLQAFYQTVLPVRTPLIHANSFNHPTWSYRPLSTTLASRASTADTAPNTSDRGPRSDEDTQTDFGQMDIFASVAQPATTIDACLPTGFHLNNGLKITHGDGMLLLGGQAFAWRPWLATSSRSHGGMLNSKGGWEATAPEVWGALEAVFPKPDLLILGLGQNVLPIGWETKERLYKMGIRIDVQDTRNAAAEFNLLATERGVSSVAAALVPIGWDSKRR